MKQRLVIGANSIGQALATQLVEQGDYVIVASRAGTKVPGATAVMVDASDVESLIRVAEHSETIFVTDGPRGPYGWGSSWPYVIESVIGAARWCSSDVVIFGDLNTRGVSPARSLAEDSALSGAGAKVIAREAGWERALLDLGRGEVRAVEVRANDYFGPGVGNASPLGPDFFNRLIAGKQARAFSDDRQPRSWSYIYDIASTMVAAGKYGGEWPSVWRAPTAEPLTRRQIAERINAIAWPHGGGVSWPTLLLRALRLFQPAATETTEELQRFNNSLTADASVTERLLGVAATPWSISLPATIDYYRSTTSSVTQRESYRRGYEYQAERVSR
jgi:nucleoside-diphosphate-sugar epimerase